MTSNNLDAAYAPFVACLLGGRFGDPVAGGWTAELVAAHVARNNNLIAETAEQVAAGAEVSYDNATAIDEVQLADYADRAGGLPGLAAEVERSASRMAAAREALGDQAGTMIHAFIMDGSTVVQDGPVPIGALIEGNASFHLNMHLEQLKALEQETTADPPSEFDSYQLVLLVRADAPVLDEQASTELGRQHLGHFRKMSAAGFLRIAGPIGGDEEIAGICLYQAGSEERALKLAEDDPAVRAGRFVPRVMTWWTAKGALRWDGAQSAQS